jgi:hypothetical protein
LDDPHGGEVKREADMREDVPGAGTDWERAERDLRWCLIEGRGVDGRDVLFEALQMKDPARRRVALGHGAAMSLRDEAALANWLACARADPARLENLGRAIIGLSPVPDG